MCDGLTEDLTVEEVIQHLIKRFDQAQKQTSDSAASTRTQPIDPALALTGLCDHVLEAGSTDNMSIILLLPGVDGRSYRSKPEFLLGSFPSSSDALRDERFLKAFFDDARVNGGMSAKEVMKRLRLKKKARDERSSASEGHDDVGSIAQDEKKTSIHLDKQMRKQFAVPVEETKAPELASIIGGDDASVSSARHSPSAKKHHHGSHPHPWHRQHPHAKHVKKGMAAEDEDEHQPDRPTSSSSSSSSSVGVSSSDEAERCDAPMSDDEIPTEVMIM